MRYKVGDKVRIKNIDWYNENKDYDKGIIYFEGSFDFTESMSKYCGQIATITHIIEKYDEYKINLDHGYYAWTDKMFEVLVEEEIKPKFKVGDIIGKSDFRFRIIKVESDRYIVEETPGIYLTLLFKIQDKFRLMEEKNNHIIETVIDTVRESNDRYRIVIDPRFDIEVDEGEYYAVRRKKKYPETFKECRDYIESCYDEPFCADLIATGYKSKLIESFAKLLVCRDAYWRIAGEEMGLEKPWEPDWRDNYQKKWTINFYQDEINLTNGPNVQFILAFPSEEMRDTFYNNFKELIEICKEFL